MSPGAVPVSAVRAGPRSLVSACIDGGVPAKRRRAGARSSAKCFAEIGGWCARHRTPAVGQTFCATTPTCRHRPPRARSALMPGCAARGWRSQTSTRLTLLRSHPTRRPRDRVRVRSDGVDVEPRALQARRLERRIPRTDGRHSQQSNTRPAMSDAGPDDRALRPLAGGRLLSEITNRIVAFMREH